MITAVQPEAWVTFVVSAPSWARIDHLSVVVGQPAESIRKLRATTSRPPREEGQPVIDFAELFARWHGRAPTDAEWPIPNKFKNTYEWTQPESVLLASLVGQFDPTEIAKALTLRLQQVTGDPRARRSRTSILVRMNKIGLETRDVLGGITVADAAREYGSLYVVQDAIYRGDLPANKVGRLYVIPHDAWQAWRATRRPPPDGYVILTSLKEPLAIRSDKLPEFAKMGYIPGALLCHPHVGQASGQRGTWFIPQVVADQLRADRHAGRPMPWHGKPLIDNLRSTWKLWQQRKHPESCPTCADIWGEAGAPTDWDSYVKRYAPLPHGAKRHLTRPWSPGITIAEAARKAKRSDGNVRRAISNGQLPAVRHGNSWYVAATALTRWIAVGSPSGDRANDWMALKTASDRYGFSTTELRKMIGDNRLMTRAEPAGPRRGELQVPWRQVAQLREDIGFTREEAALKVGVSVTVLQSLLDGVNWRGQAGIPLVTVQAVIKRLNSRQGYSVAEAAAEVGRSVTWIHARVADGTVQLHTTRWSDRAYITKIGLEDLRRAANVTRVEAKVSGEWLLGVQAAILAGVSATTLIQWSHIGLIDSRPSGRGLVHEAESVKAQARRYWSTTRFTRDRRPAWLKAESPAFRPERAQRAGKQHTRDG